MAPKLITAAALGIALAGPAFAQGQQGQQQSQPSGQQQQATRQERLRQQLTQAGFRDVQILDTAYLVQARTQDGGVVLMTVNPPNGGPQASGASAAPGGGSSGGTGKQQGSGSGRAQ